MFAEINIHSRVKYLVGSEKMLTFARHYKDKEKE
jgi:hypothetical protein